MISNVVLVHGAWVDGSGWRAVHDLLIADGFAVSVAQNPTVTLADDAAAVRRVLDQQTGPTILVGHSYGGAVITEAGTHENVVGLVYVAAFAPDKGESVNSLIPEPQPGTPVPPILPPADGFLLLDREKFPEAFAADLPADEARFLAASQTPWGLGAIGGVITEAAWRTKPSRYLLTTADRMIPPAGQRAMADRIGARVTEVAASHAVYVSQPASVAALIREATATA
ncbi:alpha/beta fold hydrolase [Cryptosporangium aurantiacum]|uniref:Pimeloyl-ACP methyl ester carboxylesterase n=1 Tax=Cryptosporangium aurantiacum TaxID=134849 RepID=A0A1M7RAF7_9ACTN|nr:alpha/beta hydrolase [Cryptosporangium aurantiacum]SHN43142.1 Pimeloyl-ACP methyl ester carboxylesterase [Cryptosporangium aurantiacum]